MSAGKSSTWMAAILLMTALSASAWAQTTTGIVDGRVVDVQASAAMTAFFRSPTAATLAELMLRGSRRTST